MSKSLPTTVYIEEEYGYRYWVWEPPKSPEELAEWWRALNSVDPYFFSPKGLPGKVRQISHLRQTKGVWFCHLHMNGDSFLRSPEGEIIHHAGYNPEE